MVLASGTYEATTGPSHRHARDDYVFVYLEVCIDVFYLFLKGEAFDGLRNATHLDWQVTYTHRVYVFPRGRNVMRMHMGLCAYA